MELDYDQNHKHGLDQPPVDGSNLIGTAKHIILEASDSVKLSEVTEYTTATTTPVYRNKSRVFRAGTVRITVKAKRPGKTYAGNLQFMVDGVNVEELTLFSSSTFGTYSFDATVLAGSYIKLRTSYLVTKDFSISFDRKIYE